MFRQRLFWKLFLSFWAALLLFAFFVLYAASAYLDATRERYDTQDPRPRNESIFAVAQSAADNGFTALQQWARHVDETELVPVLVLDAREKDILGRDASARALGRLAFILKERAEDKARNRDAKESKDQDGKGKGRRSPLMLPDGREYWLVPDFQGATLSRLISRPRVVATQLVLATLIGAIVCLGLAAYLTASLRRLREATVAFGSGDFSHRVAPTLGRRRDEFFDLAQAMDTMAERIDALINSQRGLLRDVSHELRSPLARVQVAVGLARQRIGNQADAELLRIDNEMDRLNELIGRIIDFSRLDAGLNPVRHETLRLEQILADSIEDAQLEADRKQCLIKCDLPAEAMFDGDAQLISSAIENILRNAVRHSPENGTITVSLKQADKHWQIDIADQGSGIPEELQSKVFEPFFRVDDHRNPQGGIGLGLAIARQAVAAHHGNIALHNLISGGLLVTLQLPISSSSEKATS
jgi:two-component system sensor histidine kinase CpxA